MTINRVNRYFHIGLVGLILVLIFLIYSLTAPNDITIQHGGVDGAELAVAGLTGGVAHPPGYAVFTLITWLWLRMPLGVDVINQLYLLNHILAVITIISWTVYIRRTTNSPSNSVLLILLLALNFSFWSQAIIHEVYIASMLGFVLIFLSHSLEKISLLWSCVSGFIWGIAITHHLSSVLWFLGLAILWGTVHWRLRLIGILGGMATGYSLLLLLASENSFANWGYVHTSLSAFVAHITGSQYTHFLQPLSLEGIFDQFVWWLKTIINDFTPLFASFLVIGLLYGFLKLRRLFLITLSLVLPLIVFTSLYTARDTDSTYLLPMYALISFWIMMGIEQIFRLPLNRWKSLLISFINLFVFSLLFSVHHDSITIENESMREVIETIDDFAPDNAIVISETDEVTFALWYSQVAEGFRPDIAVVDARLLHLDWYQAHLQNSYELNNIQEKIQSLIHQDDIKQRPILSAISLLPRTDDQWYLMENWFLLLPSESN